MKTTIPNTAGAGFSLIGTLSAKSIATFRHDIHLCLAEIREINQAAIALSILMSICGMCLLTIYTAFGVL